MDNLDNEHWLKDIMQEVAEDHNVLLLENDPVLINAILNKKVLEYFHKKQEQLLHRISDKWISQFEVQHENNQKVFLSVAEKLIKGVNHPVKKKSIQQKRLKAICSSLHLFLCLV